MEKRFNMVIDGMLISILVGYLRKGRLKNFDNIEVKAWYLLFIGGFIQVIAMRFSVQSSEFGNFIKSIFFELHLLSYFLILLTMLVQFKKHWAKAFAIGTFLNGLVIAFNSGKMPVKLPSGLNDQFDMGHTLLTQSTRLPFLADIFYLPKPYPLPKILSVGDLFLLIGAFIFVQYAMISKPVQQHQVALNEVANED